MYTSGIIIFSANIEFINSMSITLKGTGDHLLGIFNFNIPRKLNGKKMIVPVKSGIKVTISGEKWMSEMLKLLFKYSNGTFLDIGVNLGQTLAKVKTIDPGRNYIGIEPNPSCIFYLQHLIKANNWQKTTLVPTGVYTSDCLLNLVGEHETHGSSTVIDDFKDESRFSEFFSKLVPLMSFDTIENAIPDDTISFIKIDVEGAELEVMQSLQDAIKKHRPIILLEVWQNNNDQLKISRADKLNDIVKSLNYAVLSWIEIGHPPFFQDLKDSILGESETDNFILLPNENKEEIIKVLRPS